MRIAAALTALLLVGGCARKAAHHEVALWAWERAEDLRRIPDGVAVELLAQTVSLRDGRMSRHPRNAPLRVAPGQRLTAVTRIDSHGPLSGEQRAAAAAAILSTAGLPGVVEVQIDYDARLSERPFYRQLLGDVRAGLPATTRLTMTALASWCLGDDWLAGLPVDEAIPMLFRLGVHGAEVDHALARGDFTSPLCRHSVGVSTDEPEHWRLAPGRRVHVFSPHAWSDRDVRRVIAEVDR